MTTVEKGLQARFSLKQTITKQRENKGNVFGEESNYSINDELSLIYIEGSSNFFNKNGWGGGGGGGGKKNYLKGEKKKKKKKEENTIKQNMSH